MNPHLLYNKGIAKGRRGFTFIELILTVSLVGVLTLVIFGTLNHGLRLWQRLNQELVLVDANIFLDKFSSDVKSTFPFVGMGLNGQEESIAFAGLVSLRQDPGESPGSISYAYSPDKKELVRSVNDYAGFYHGEEGRFTHRLENVNQAEFEYYYFDETKQNYQWIKAWPQGALPLAVRLSFKLFDGVQEFSLVRTVSLGSSYVP